MKKSIRSKLFISVSLLLISFIVLLLFLNSQYLDQYYIKIKKDALIENAKYLESIYKGNVDDIQLELEKAANRTSSSIQIRDSKGRLKYSSGSRFGNVRNLGSGVNLKRHAMLIPNQKTDIENLEEYAYGKYVFKTQREMLMKIDFLALITRFSNGDILFIRVPLISIEENVNIANRFIIFTGIIIMLLGSILTFVFSKKFTGPILELNNIARDMAKFDFTKRCSIRSMDEIGQLGESINYLSGELDRAISELNIKNKKLEEDIEKERKLDEMRKEFISNVSHELRTPISLIQGYAEGIASNVNESNEDRKFYCDVIISETNRMSRLVSDLLNLSQIESGYFKLEKTEFNLNSLIEYILNKYKAVFTEKVIKVENNSEGNFMAYGDMARIEQVFTNYLTNAIDHVDDKKLIRINTYAADDKIRVGVFNSGNHIPEDLMDKIWISFYKADRARTRAYGGYGLGLSIVKAIQELHNNGYGVENVDGGVNFWFEVDMSKGFSASGEQSYINI